MNIGGAILAGGRGQRMGGVDKALLALSASHTLLHVAIARLAPQVDGIVLNANGDPSRFAAFGVPVVADRIDGFVGPLAGLHAVLDDAARSGRWSHVVTVPADTPFLPADLVAGLTAAAADATEIVIAASLGRGHPVIGLWPVCLAGALRDHLTSGAGRSMMAFLAGSPHRLRDFPARPDSDPFFNVNTSEDLEEARRRLVRSTTPGQSPGFV